MVLSVLEEMGVPTSSLKLLNDAVFTFDILSEAYQALEQTKENLEDFHPNETKNRKFTTRKERKKEKETKRKKTQESDAEEIEEVFDEILTAVPQMFSRWGSSSVDIDEAVAEVTSSGMPMSDIAEELKKIKEKTENYVKQKNKEEEKKANGWLSGLFTKTDTTFANILRERDSQLNSFVALCKTKCASLPKDTAKLLLKIMIFALIIYCVRKNKKITLVVSIVCFLLAFDFNVIKSVLQDFKDKVVQLSDVMTGLYVTSSGDVQAQSAIDSLTLLPSLFVGKGIIDKAVDGKVVDHITRNFATSKQAIPDLVKLVMEILNICLDAIGYGHIARSAEISMFTSDTKYRELIDEIWKIERGISDETIRFIPENFEHIRSLMSQADSLLIESKKYQSSGGLQACIQQCIHRIRNCHKKFEESGFRKEGLRQEPVAILLKGCPGTLKSQTQHHINVALAAACLEGKALEDFLANPQSVVFNRQTETEYYDGYNHNKFIINIDDFMQLREVPGSGHSEVFDFIRAKNENDHVLHMSAVGDKGTMRNVSKFIIMTTNVNDFNPNTIIDKRALMRRFDFIYTPVPKAGFEKIVNGEKLNHGMKAQVDMNKLPLGSEGITSTKPGDILEFEVVNKHNNEYTGEKISFEEMIKRAVEQFKFRRKCYLQKLSEEEETIKTFLPLNENTNPEPQSFFGAFVSSVKKDVMPGRFDSENYPLPSASVIQDCYSGMVHSVEKWKQIVEFLDDLKIDNEVIRKVCLNPAFSKQADKYYELFTYTFNRCVALNEHVEATKILEAMVLEFGPRRVFLLEDEDFEWHDDYCAVAEVISYNYSKYVLLKDLKRKVLFFDSDAWRDNMTSRISNAFSKVLSTPRYALATSLATIAGITMVIYASYKAVMCLLEWTGVIAPENQSRDSKKFQAKHFNKPRPKVSRKNFASPQVSMVSDDQCVDIMRKVLKGNTYDIFFSNDERDPFDMMGQIVFVHDNLALMPHHFVDLMDFAVNKQEFSRSRIRLTAMYTRTQDAASVEFFVKDILEKNAKKEYINVIDSDNLLAQDLVLVRFPFMTPRPSMLKYIADRNYVTNLRARQNVILGKVGICTEMTMPVAYLVKETLVRSPEFGEYTINKTFCYNVYTKKGDCGTLLAVMDKSNSRSKICGMHVAGIPTVGKGYASVFCREDIEDAVQENGDISILESQLSDLSVAETQSDKQVFSKMMNIREETGNISIPFKSKLRRSPLYGNVSEVLTRPSKMTPPNEEFDEDNPWVKAYSNYRMQVPAVDNEIVKRAASQVKDMLFRESKVVIKDRLLTFEEAVAGIEGTTFGGISRKTSPGYPDILSSTFRTSGRKKYFGEDGEYDLSGEYVIGLRKHLNDIIEKAENNVRCEHVFVDYLKDEKREHEKVLESKTRLFSAGPLRLLILYRMYFGRFMMWYQENRIDNQSAVGVNVYSAEWDYAAKKLMEKVDPNIPSIGAGDYSKFDGSELPNVHWHVLDIIESYYRNATQKERNVRRTLWLEVVNSKHYFNGYIREWTSSLPSGHPLTTQINNLYNNIAFRVCWFNIFKNTDLEYKFDENVYLLTLGDDNVFSVTRKCIDQFNEATIAKQMATIGLTYTKEDKTFATNSLRNITEVEFLKRRFRYDTLVRRFVAPLRLTSVFEMLNWTKNGPFIDEIPRDNVDTALRELTLHGQEVFDRWEKIITNASIEHLEHYPRQVSYLTLHNLICNAELIL